MRFSVQLRAAVRVRDLLLLPTRAQRGTNETLSAYVKPCEFVNVSTLAFTDSICFYCKKYERFNHVFFIFEEKTTTVPSRTTTMPTNGTDIVPSKIPGNRCRNLNVYSVFKILWKS